MVFNSDLLSDTQNDESTNEKNSGEPVSTDKTRESDGTEDIRKMLDMENEWKWEESIEAKSSTIKVNAQIHLPATSTMKVVKIQKRYLTSEDRKQILEKIFDKDSIKLDVENPIFPTKANLKAQLSDYERAIKTMEETGDARIAELSVLKCRVEKCQEMLVSAPESVSATDLGDYSFDYYVGTRDGVPYGFSFKSEPENNISKMRMYAEKMTTSDGTEPEYCNVLFTPAGENKCVMTEEEAVQKAKEFLHTIGVDHMELLDTSYIEMVKPDQTTEMNGYRLVFSMCIENVAVDNTTYMAADENLLMGEYTFPYASERIVIDINDSGILNFIYQGVAEEMDSSEPVKLLSYEQIQNIFRQEIAKIEAPDIAGFDPYCNLYLDYVRVKNPEDENTFSYVPAWKLSSFNDASGYIYNMPEDEQMWINAMDGSVIDASKEDLLVPNADIFNDDIEYLIVDSFLNNP